MSDAGLNAIFDRLGDLTATVKSLAEKIDSNERRNVAAIHEANEGRANVHRRLDELVIRTTHVESDLSSMASKVLDMEKVTGAVKTMRDQAEGAGTLGRWLLWLGGFVLSAASGFAAAYTYLTGRPPP